MINFKTDYYRRIFWELSKKKINFLHGTYLYASQNFACNYSHFTLQCLGVILLAKELNLINHTLIIIRPDLHSRFQDELLKTFNLDKFNYTILDPTKVYKIDNLFYCDSLFDYSISKSFIEVYERAAQKLHFNKNRFKQRIYLTRINNKTNRVAINEQELIDYLSNSGFQILDFDNMTILDQIGAIIQAKVICAPHGASGANLVYKQKDKFKFIEIFSQNRLINFHANILQAKNCNYTATVNKAQHPHIAGHIEDGPFEIDIDLLKETYNTYNHKFHQKACYDVFPESAYNKLLSMASKNNLEFFSPKNNPNSTPEDLIFYILSLFKISCDKNTIHKYLLNELFVQNREDFSNIIVKLSRLLEDKSLYPILFNLINKTFNYSNIYKLIKWNKNNLGKNDYYSYINCILQQQNFINNQFCLQKSTNSKEFSSTALLTWHNSFIYLSQDKRSIKHGLNLQDSYPITNINERGISLKDREKNIFIQDIGNDGNINWTTNEVFLNLEKRGENIFSIKIKNKYLSARNDGSFLLQPTAQEWELFFINKYFYHS